jgi:TorA maturation chaperone TorD
MATSKVVTGTKTITKTIETKVVVLSLTEDEAVELSRLLYSVYYVSPSVPELRDIHSALDQADVSWNRVADKDSTW